MNSELNPWYMGYFEKDGKSLAISLEVLGEKSLEEIKKEFEKMSPFGFKFKRMEKVATNNNSQGGKNGN